MTDASGTITRLKPVEATTHAWAVPWSVLALLVVLAVIVVLAVRARRRRAGQEDARVQAAIAEALRERESVES